ncbi:hypothetical protein LB467_13855 [Salegentibacter sp. JZCK2]|uniref:hypothetical protein n=1 Tax=Salegentibacter tibetensis TaxID=2873600 RepID=UPI001CCEF815|nr:hypothetical protein [Salegentibacter tibetensis]MBZ9730775.1 hypothetical protein [Salegentibacter tibetensis]
MLYKYNLPNTVLRPTKNVRVLFDNGNFHEAYSVAILEWNNNDVLAIRWNITENEAKNPEKMKGSEVCVGEPNSHGYSTWFIIPDDFIKQKMNNTPLNNKLEE